MEIYSRVFRFRLPPQNAWCDVTPHLKEVLLESGVREGDAVVAVRGSTAGVMTTEKDPNLLDDYSRLWETLAPIGADYRHNDTWGDHNGYSHLRSALQGTSLTIPVTEGELFIGVWQQVIVLNFDEREREREVLFQIRGIK